jgi:hypothetical protein
MKPKNHTKQIIASDIRIFNALQVLQSHSRGLNTLAQFKRMCEFAQGLDSAGMRSLQILTNELALGRRNFLAQIGTDSRSLFTALPVS